MFFHKEAFSISSLRDDVRIKTFYKALRKVSHFGNKHTAVTKSAKSYIAKRFCLQGIKNRFFLSLPVLLYISFTQPAA